MGSIASGRIAAFRKTVDKYPSIDVNRWNREGLLEEGKRFIWQMSFNSPRLDVSVLNKQIRLIFSIEQPYKQVISLGYSNCHLAGFRTWFMCECGKRVVKLYYYDSGLFQCRLCLKLLYESTSCTRNKVRTAILKHNRILKKALRYGIKSDSSPRPKGVNKNTYNSIIKKLKESEHNLTLILNSLSLSYHEYRAKKLSNL